MQAEFIKTLLLFCGLCCANKSKCGQNADTDSTHDTSIANIMMVFTGIQLHNKRPLLDAIDLLQILA